MSAARGTVLRLERAASRVLSRRARALLRPLRRRPPGVELDGWDGPLVAGRTTAPFPAPPPVPAPVLAPVPAAAPAPGTSGERRRCLLVTHSLETGGVDEVVSHLARSLPAHGFDVAVLVASDDEPQGIGQLGRRLLDDGVEVVDAAGADGARWIEGWRPDVVYLHGDVRWPVRVARRLGVPAVLALHGMHDLFALDGGAVLERSRDLAAVVAVSELVREEYLAKSGGLDAAAVHVIPNGVHPDKVSAVGHDACRASLGLEDETLFVSLARHNMQKNTYALVEAFEDVARALPRAHLLVCGRADEAVYSRQVVARRDRSPAADRIHLRDNLWRVDAVLAAADVFVLDSYFEGWALSSMEALAAGTPVVLSDVGGAREQVGGPVANGVVVGHPLGRPVGLTWDEMEYARFRRQPNREEVVDAMVAVARGDYAASRAEIAADAARRFSPARSVRAHADLLRRVVAG
ncbi:MULTISPECIES: glycosyltransferase family 4 protein [unclassified Isoptericola]|uniref:glycosyltransferase family 4 protein n=1 Tax=unclassified Isoptericola TaxID=2623355 RepID=UPI00365BFA89